MYVWFALCVHVCPRYHAISLLSTYDGVICDDPQQSRYLLAYKTAHERLHSQTLDNNGQLSAASPLKIMIQSPNASVSTLASRGGTTAEVGMTAEQRQAIRRAVIRTC